MRVRRARGAAETGPDERVPGRERWESSPGPDGLFALDRTVSSRVQRPCEDRRTSRDGSRHANIEARRNQRRRAWLHRPRFPAAPL